MNKYEALPQPVGTYTCRLKIGEESPTTATQENTETPAVRIERLWTRHTEIHFWFQWILTAKSGDKAKSQ